ncbi:MAG: hypothetical protein HY082_10870 [Gammaproteobacteria bacterium]|nr:hypothetical protein [Gammaproteobacteria bacterium]
MKPKKVFDWKFRNRQAALVEMVLALLFFTGCATSAQADSFTCKQYLAASEENRLSYVLGIAEGYDLATRLLNVLAASEKDKKLRTGLAFNATVLAKYSAAVGKLTLGATVEMLDAECAKSPNERAVNAFNDVMTRLN